MTSFISLDVSSTVFEVVLQLTTKFRLTVGTFVHFPNWVSAYLGVGWVLRSTFRPGKPNGFIRNAGSEDFKARRASACSLVRPSTDTLMQIAELPGVVEMFLTLLFKTPLTGFTTVSPTRDVRGGSSRDGTVGLVSS